MPRQRTRKQFLNFVGGLNTEANPLIFPENTAKALDNVDLRRDGSVKRRRGMNYESLGVLSSAGSGSLSFTESDLDGWAITTHEWKSVNGDDARNFLVLQIGGTLYFHKLGEAVTSSNYIGSISLSAISTRTDYEHYPVSADSAKGRLFIVSRGISPAYISFDVDAQTFSGVKLTIKIRDIDGIPEDRSSPIVFGDDVSPGTQTDPEDDYDDVIVPPTGPLFDEFIVESPL